MEFPLLIKVADGTVSRRLALIGLFSAVYAVFRYIPTFPMYGLPGTNFRAGDFLAPILGILLGPWLAIPCIVIGTVLNYAVVPPLFLGLDFLPACMSATVAGLITSGRTRSAIVLYAALLGTFLVNPLSTFWIQITAGLQVPYAWLHIIAFLALVSPIGFNAYKWTRTSVGMTLVLGVLVTVFSATMAQHLTGGILQELILFPASNFTPARAAHFWSFIFYLYPIERFVITVVATFFGVSVMRAVKTSGLETVLARIRGPSYSGRSVRQEAVQSN